MKFSVAEPRWKECGNLDSGWWWRYSLEHLFTKFKVATRGPATGLEHGWDRFADRLRLRSHLVRRGFGVDLEVRINSTV